MAFYLSTTLGYYEGDQLDPADVVVTRRPDPTYVWQNGAWAQPLAIAQAAQIAALAAAYEAASSRPVSYSTKAGVANLFQADPASQAIVQQSLAGYQGAAAVPAGFYWVAADNAQVPFDFADLQGLAAAMIAQGWSAFQELHGLKAEVLAATTVAAVQAVVWS